MKKIYFLLLFYCLTSYSSVFAEYMRWTMIDVGNADAHYIKLPNGKDVIIDGGNEGAAIITFLNGLTDFDGVIDYMVLTHAHADHSGGLDELLAAYQVNKVYSPGYEYGTSAYNAFKNAVIAEPGCEWIKKGSSDSESSGGIFNIGETLSWDPSVIIKCLSVYNQSNPNANSIVLKMDFGESSFLFTGDLAVVVDTILANYNSDVPSDIHKIAHHGSRSSGTNSSEWINKVHSEDSGYAFFPVGSNLYGHPKTTVLSRLINTKTIIYRSDLDGNITVKTDGKGNYDIVRSGILLYTGNANSFAPPALPTGLKITDFWGDFIELAWDTTTLDSNGIVIPGNVQYNVFRATVAGGDPGAGLHIHPGMTDEVGIYVQVTTEPVSVSAFKDTTVQPSKIYYYRVSAIRTDYYYERRYSNEIKGHTDVFPPSQITDLSASVTPELIDKEILLTWTIPGDDGTISNNSIGSYYTLRYATYNVSGSTTSWWENADRYGQSWEVGLVGSQASYIVKNFDWGATYYFAVKTTDESGNTSVMSSTPLAGSVPQVDVTSPTVSKGLLFPAPLSAGIPHNSYIKLCFSEGMSSQTVKDAFKLEAVKDNTGYSITPWTVDCSFEELSKDVFNFIPSELLKKGYTYKVTVTTVAKDLATIDHPGLSQLSLENPYSWEFVVIMNKDLKNRVAKSDGTEIIISANTYNNDYYVRILTLSESGKILKANKKLRQKDAASYPVALREFSVYDISGGGQKVNSGYTIKISIPYDGQNDLKKPVTLWHLDEKDSIWVKIPEIAATAHFVSAYIHHLSVYGIIRKSDTDLSFAFAYPVPWKPNDGIAKTGTAEEGVKFKNLGSIARIRIYNIAGDLIKTLNYDYRFNEEPFKWDGTNTSGDPVASGLYIYYIDNNVEHRRGSLIVIK